NQRPEPEVSDHGQGSPTPAPVVAQPGGDLTAEASRELARRCFLVLRWLWPAHTTEEAFGAPPGEPRAEAPAFSGLGQRAAIREWAVAAEDFVALVLLRYLGQFVVQIRTLLLSLTLGSLLLVLTAAVYPFFPQSQLLLFLSV